MSDLLPMIQQGNNGSDQTTVSDPDSVTTSADLGSLPGTAVNIGMDFAGVPSSVQSGVNAVMSSSSFSELQDSLLSSLAGTLASTAVDTALPGVTGLPSLAGALASESTKQDSNFSAAAIKSGLTTAASVLGTATLGPFGGFLTGTLGGYAVESSLRDGWLGDVADSRSSEKERDAVEDGFGFTQSQTADMAATQRGLDAFGVPDKGFGLDAAYDSTTAGQLAASAKTSPLTDDSSLSSYLDSIDATSSVGFGDGGGMADGVGDGTSQGSDGSAQGQGGSGGMMA